MAKFKRFPVHHCLSPEVVLSRILRPFIKPLGTATRTLACCVQHHVVLEGMDGVGQNLMMQHVAGDTNHERSEAGSIDLLLGAMLNHFRGVVEGYLSGRPSTSRYHLRSHFEW